MEIILAVSAFLILQTLWKYLFRTKQSAPAEVLPANPELAAPRVREPFSPELDAKLKIYFAQVKKNMDDMAELKRRHKERFPNG